MSERYQALEDGKYWGVLETLGEDEVCWILEFLGARDLLNLSCASRWSKFAACKESLWKKLYIHDFSCQGTDRISLNFRDPKTQYIKRIEEREKRLLKASENEWIRNVLRRLERRRDTIEWLADFINVRLLTSSAGVLVFCTLIFISLKLDSRVNWSVWAVLGPLWIFSLIFFVASVSGCVLYHFRVDADSLFHGMFDRLRGIVWFFLDKVFDSNRRAIASGAVLAVLIFIFVILIAIKLTCGKMIPWSAVFIPLWLVFIITSATPCLRWAAFAKNCVTYFSCMIFVWLPLLAFFSLLDSKLSGARMFMEVVFVPLWLMNFLILAGSLAPLIYQVVRWCVNREHIDEAAIGFCGLVCCLITPMITFEILVCLCDHRVPHVSPGEVLIPILILGAFASVVLCIFAWTYTSPFNRHQLNRNNHASMGMGNQNDRPDYDTIRIGVVQ